MYKGRWLNRVRDDIRANGMSGEHVYMDAYIYRLTSTKHKVRPKPLSHRIVRLLDRTIGCYLANVRPIGNVCYDRQQRSHTAIGLSSWW